MLALSILLSLALLLLAAFVFAYVFMPWKAKKELSFGQSEDLEHREKPIAIQHAKILSVMDEIDCAILSNSSFERVVELVFPCALEFISCSLVAITQLDKAPTDQSGTMAVTRDGRRTNYPALLDKPLRRVLDHNPDGYLLEKPETYPSLKPLTELGATRILMLPIYRDAKLSAVLHLGFTDNSQIPEDAHQVARYFSDRLGVALTAVMREKSLYYHEHFDQITSLPNRRSCCERLSLEISRANRYKLRIAILYISLDGFKKINDAAGYAGGDSVLKQVAERLRSNLREADLAARFGNNEFVVILPDIGRTAGISKVAEKLIDVLFDFYTYDEHQYHLNSSMGISIYPDDGQSVDTLLQNADMAMARTKTKGPGQFVFHEEQINSVTTGRLALERDLRKALQREELFLLYQPQIDLRKGDIVGLEALVRWRHPTRGIISPLEFIAIAEESDLIDQIGAYVRKTACAQYREWETRGIAPLRMALNVSSKELMRNSFTADFQATLRETGVQPTSIELEITESLLLDISGQVNTSLQSLRQQGIRIAIDDFGTGYSCLSYLVQLPFDVLKIDRSFVGEIGKPSGTYEIVSVIIDMAHHLRKTVCAEGIETESQLMFLRERGCEIAQGYFLSHPITAEEFEIFSSQWQADWASRAVADT